ncbi:DUF4350 domain-containing protein [Streptomyces aidingensis]|uniref:DUF4350 domain-containing protein n=1 Tax=Streptomyces aidingensis TaxID=910347 RepID=A0A1I1E2M0_9ACTN|nr:DUF4350 domain-containing protein [Streptomyces aidingensis]SFB79190.1 protein of unknown function [Streptomyces aidingensis]
MTAPAPATAAPAATSVSPTAGDLFRRARGPLAGIAVVLLAGLVLGLLRGGDGGRLDPRSPTPGGTRAVARLLAGHGVDTTVVTTTAEAAAAAGPDTTLVVAVPELLAESQWDTLYGAAAGSGVRTVLLGPTPPALDRFAPGVQIDGYAEPGERDPGCTDPAATRAGSARLGGWTYLSGPGAAAAADRLTGCYRADGLPSLVTLTGLTAPEEGGPDDETVLLGTPDPLQNEHLDDLGNASLAMQLLGARPHLVWYLPSPDDVPVGPDGEREELPFLGSEGLLDLLPAGWRWAALQLGIAAALAALWRMRRLGPAVTEPLPVVVRAAETTEGRARLYHRAGARDRAAEALRDATRHRIAPLLGVTTAGSRDATALPAAVAARTGASAAAVHHLLYGPAPADDPALVRLADELDALERRLGPATAATTAAAAAATATGTGADAAPATATTEPDPPRGRP